MMAADELASLLVLLNVSPFFSAAAAAVARLIALAALRFGLLVLLLNPGRRGQAASGPQWLMMIVGG